MKDFEEIGQLYEIAPWYLVGTSQHRSISTYCDAERYIKGRWKESIRDIRETPTYGSLWRTDVSAILGARLREITGALLVLEGKTIDEIMPGIDAVKLKSSMTLFDAVCPDDIFSEVLDKYFRGERDKMTLSCLD